MRMKTTSRTVDSIQRVDISSLTPKIFAQQYQKPGIPVVITGLLEGVDWNLDYLCDKLGNQEFLLRFYGHQRYKHKQEWTSIGSGVAAQSMRFTEYANLLRNGKAHEDDIYLAKCSIKNTPLAYVDSLPNIGEVLGLDKPFSDLNIWIGPGGHVESLHYDAVDGTLMQLHGAKKLVLFPPSQMYNLYPFPLYVHLRHGFKLRSWFSRVYPEQPDFKSFPRLAAALQHKHEVILEQGEIIYIPAGWWHEVTALGNEMVCSVNRFWRVYPISRAAFSWHKWRNIIGIVYGLPNIFLSLAIAICSSNRKTEIRKILQML